MTRCDYDAVFYRVFCITLLAIAFTFTVILTNVFIDIDGLLASKKEKFNARVRENMVHDDFANMNTDNDDLNYGENDDSYRTKRSIETQNFLFHIKNPKIKNILTNRLTTLLEELDAEEPTPDIKIKDKKNHKENTKEIEIIDTKATEDSKNKAQPNDNLLHLTMHNILLQGIIGHMDLNDVYKRVHATMANIKMREPHKDLTLKPDEVPQTAENKPIRSTLEDKFLEELVNCRDLQTQIMEVTTSQPKTETKKPNIVKGPNVIIKTVIDITSIGNDKSKEIDSKNQKENIKGVIELIYNGKKLKFTTPDSELPKPQQPIPTAIAKPTPIQNKITETTNLKEDKDVDKIPKSYLHKFVEEYFKRFPNDREISNETKEKYETKRIKRYIKIKDGNDDGSKENSKHKKKSEDDELYVEIETHFDSKGLKGEKKKKLIRSLIEKIQQAIHSDMDGKILTKGKKKKLRQLHVRKRLQNPLDHKDRVLVNKYTIPLNGFVHRQLNPITKTIPMQESSPFIGSRSGEDWKKPCAGPTFLAASKAINSAEMSEVDVDYSKVLDVNGIPQRLQKPLNTELSEETISTNSYYDIGNMKFFIKDIDGSGFSIGFNQYVDEPPDADTMKLFTGLENVIKTYHQNYDPADPAKTEATPIIEENPQETEAPNNEHIIVRRSVNKKHDYHSNEYRIIFDDNFLPYNSYRDIFGPKKPKKYDKTRSKKHVREMPLVVDENIFERNLKPAEIFGLANLFERKKRSLNVKKISNLKSKIKLNRFLNTKTMSSKRIYLNKKRNKRQINKIRIIATDLPHMSKNSDENIFVVSDENVFADRAIVKEVETSEMDHEKQEESEYIPYQPEENIAMPASYVTKLFDARSRHNPLMAKYPHIFMEEISRSREEYIPDNALLFGKIPGLSKLSSQSMEPEKNEDKAPAEQANAPSPVPNATEQPKLPKVQEIVNALAAPLPKAKYKVTVKIVPKNLTGLNSGFKEIHTSINKRFNKNGLMYSSLVNVSEISKVVKLNRSKEMAEYKPADAFLTKKIKDQQDKMQLLLKQHARHINEQLNRLKEEKSNIESFLVDGDNSNDTYHLDYVDLGPQLSAGTPKPPKVLLSKEEINQIAAEAFKDTYTSTTVQLTEAPVITTIPITTPAPIFSDKLKHNILTTIEKNENLTDQILKKIDKNTELLQIFLKKLTEKIELTTEKPTEEHILPKIDMNSFSSDWRNHGVQFNQNMVIRKNDSHISIPFVYAYQQPIITQKRDAPVASVVYHGHIHANTVHPKDAHGSAEKKEKVTPVHLIPETNNQSRFFIDELENDYKVIQVGDVKKGQEYNISGKNTTAT